MQKQGRSKGKAQCPLAPDPETARVASAHGDWAGAWSLARPPQGRLGNAVELMVPPAAAGHTADRGAKAPGRVDGG